MTGEGRGVQQIGKASILVMQFLPAFFAHFHSYSLITGLIQNPTRFPEALIDVAARDLLN